MRLYDDTSFANKQNKSDLFSKIAISGFRSKCASYASPVLFVAFGARLLPFLLFDRLVHVVAPTNSKDWDILCQTIGEYRKV